VHAFALLAFYGDNCDSPISPPSPSAKSPIPAGCRRRWAARRAVSR